LNEIAPPRQLNRSARFAESEVNEMRILVAVFFLVLFCFPVVAQTPRSQDESLLRSSDRAYADATEFAHFLNQQGIAVKSIHRSKLEGFFRGLYKAAFFKTDQGILEVIFFPDGGAEKVSVTEHREGKRHIYSFRGQPQPDPSRDTINAAYPEYFIMHGGWFILTLDEKLSNAVRSLFSATVPNKSLDASGGSVFRKLIRPAMRS